MTVPVNAISATCRQGDVEGGVCADIPWAGGYYGRRVPAASSPSASPLSIAADRVQQLWRTERNLVLALVAGTVLVLARSAIFLRWEQAGFDSDQAIFGLMAKHISEGRSFPLFIYGAPYMLGVQAWLAAPLFAIFGPSVAMLKLPVVLVNVATSGLLIWILHRDGGLRPLTALISSMFFVLAAPALAAPLVETGGGNPEPFLYVLLLWLLRARPFAFGLVFGIGFLHREFTLYGLTAIVGLALLDDWRMTPERWRAIGLAAVGYLVVWQLVRIGFLFSSPTGPGSAIVAPLAAGQNVGALFGRACLALSTVVPGVVSYFADYLGIMFGTGDHRLTHFGIRSTLRTSIPWVPAFWPLLGTFFLAMLGRVTWLAVRQRQMPWRGQAAIGSFLFLVGMQAGAAYAITRCGIADVGTARYALLSVYAGLGLTALFFAYEPRRDWRWLATGVLMMWTAVSATAHVRLVREYLYQEPANSRRDLATYLVTNRIRYARADYWTAYVTTFLSRERVLLASTDMIRIDDYQRQVDAHRAEAVTVQTTPCAGDGGTEAVAGMYWVCPD